MTALLWKRLSLGTLLAAGAGSVVPHLEWYAKILRTKGSHLSGLVTMLASGDDSQTFIDVELKGDRPGAAHSWVVREGSCTKAGDVLGFPNAYVTLTPDAKGIIRKSIAMTLPLPQSGEFHVTVFESTDKAGAVVACSNLRLGA